MTRRQDVERQKRKNTSDLVFCFFIRLVFFFFYHQGCPGGCRRRRRPIKKQKTPRWPKVKTNNQQPTNRDLGFFRLVERLLVAAGGCWSLPAIGALALCKPGSGFFHFSREKWEVVVLWTCLSSNTPGISSLRGVVEERH